VLSRPFACLPVFLWFVDQRLPQKFLAPPPGAVQAPTPSAVQPDQRDVDTPGLGPAPSRSRRRKKKSKPADDDLALLTDIPAWLRLHCLHKYIENIAGMTWAEVVMMDASDLEVRGVDTIGAKRKFKKVLRAVRIRQGIEHPDDDYVDPVQVM